MSGILRLQPYRLLYAKWNSGDQSPAVPAPLGRHTFHSLIYHMIDVASVTGVLWVNALSPAFRRRMACALDIDEGAAGQWVALWAGAHDLGKAAPPFQARWEYGRRVLRAVGLRFPQIPSVGPPPHGILTAVTLGEWLAGDGLPARLGDRVAAAVGGHHGDFPSSFQASRVGPRALGGDEWMSARRALMGALARIISPHGAAPSADLRRDHAFFMLLAGLSSVADWIASVEAYFPYSGAEEDPAGYAEISARRAEKACRAVGWEGPTPPPAPPPFESWFRVRPRPLQVAICELAGRIGPPALMIVEAPMGEGKTEAAVYLAARWGSETGRAGLYFALPTEATSNQMLSRVIGYLATLYPAKNVNLQLLHGHAALSAELELLRARGRLTLVPSSIEDEAGHDGAPAHIVVGEWFTQRKRGLLATFGVGTVDQVLLSVLQTKHFFVRLFGIGDKTVIIDEVHAYDAYMTVLLERLIEWLASMGCSVVLLSATLPRGRRDRLARAFALGIGRPGSVEVPECPYPRLTWVSAGGSQTSRVDTSDEATKDCRLEWMEPDEAPEPGGVFRLGERLRDTLVDGGCAAVVCNTVGQAQAVYEALKPYFPNQADIGDGLPELDQFHARYLFEDREVRERRCLVRFGKPGAKVSHGDEGEKEVKRPHRAVLVATQVIEQSLDLDFDLLVTWMAPIDFMLQRMGRLHRHSRQRPARLSAPCAWVVGPSIDPAGTPGFGGETERVYDRHILLRSWLAVRDRQRLHVPEDVESLIEAVYGDGECPPEASSGIRDAWSGSLSELRKSLSLQERIAYDKTIAAPYDPDDVLERVNLQFEEEDPKVSVDLQALTRLSEPTVTAICLYRTAGNVALDAAGQHPVDLDSTPDLDLTRALLRRSVRIAHRGCVPALLAEGLSPRGWVKSPLLRHHRVVFLGPDSTATIGCWSLHLNKELGLRITRRKEVM